jgi:hypothetical protein
VIDLAFMFAGEQHDCRERYFVCRLADGERGEPRLDPVQEVGIVAVGWWGIDYLALRPPDLLEPPLSDGCLRAEPEHPARFGAGHADSASTSCLGDKHQW